MKKQTENKALAWGVGVVCLAAALWGGVLRAQLGSAVQGDSLLSTVLAAAVLGATLVLAVTRRPRR